MRRLLLVLLIAATSGCGLTATTATPDCDDTERLALVAQSVPTAAYVPCLRALPQGWRTTAFEAADGSTRLSLLSDRAEGRAVSVELAPRCDVTGATPAAPRAEGVRSFVRLSGLSPSYAGTMYDVFPGGCVRYRFAFPRGPHIPLMEELATAIGLVRRGDLRIDVRDEVGAELDP